MEEVLLKLGFVKKELYVLEEVLDNSIICKLLDIQDRSGNRGTTLKYEMYKYKLLYEPPIVDFISVNILEDKFDIYFKSKNSNTTHTLPLDFFIIFEELLIDKRNKTLNNLLNF